MHNVAVSAPPNKFPLEIARRIIRIQILTLVWMMIEAAVSLSAAWAARSSALLGFGGDSAVELLSAAVVLRRFYLLSDEGHAEERAAKIAGGLLFALAAFVAFTSLLTLLGRVESRPSLIGITLLILAAASMHWLAKQKRQLSATTGSAALRADATESAICGYLAFDCFGGFGGQCDLESDLGGPYSCADPLASDCGGEMGGNEGRAVLRCMSEFDAFGHIAHTFPQAKPVRIHGLKSRSMMAISLEQALIEVWRQVLVENADAVELGAERFRFG
jgi:hypothetical protein